MPLPERPLGVSLWCVALDGALLPDPSMLSSDEQARAERFVFARDRQRYLVAHGALRQVLQAELGLAQGQAFETGAFGKPALARADGAGFNLSHSGGWALIGVKHGAEIGVDIEVLHSIDHLQALAEEHFSAAELLAWRGIDDTTAASHAFLLAWTRKEACLKALGTGLRVTLRDVDVGLQPLPRCVVVAVESDLMVVDVVTITPCSGAIGAVAVVRESMRKADVNDAR